MGTYSTEEWRELFGGDPEPGEAYLPLHAADHLRKEARENGLHHHRDLSGASSHDPGTPAEGRVTSSLDPSVGNSYPSRRRTGMDCDNCGAPEDVACQPWCLGEQYS